MRCFAAREEKEADILAKKRNKEMWARGWFTWGAEQSIVFSVLSLGLLQRPKRVCPRMLRTVGREKSSCNCSIAHSIQVSLAANNPVIYSMLTVLDSIRRHFHSSPSSESADSRTRFSTFSRVIVNSSSCCIRGNVPSALATTLKPGAAMLDGSF